MTYKPPSESPIYQRNVSDGVYKTQNCQEILEEIPLGEVSPLCSELVKAELAKGRHALQTTQPSLTPVTEHSLDCSRKASPNSGLPDTPGL